MDAALPGPWVCARRRKTNSVWLRTEAPAASFLWTVAWPMTLNPGKSTLSGARTMTGTWVSSHSTSTT